ncbi:MAG TPA: hypothetical protein VMJ14_12270 [Burkholderiales bacterium]|nr:hypothetical protein [Burkholderiales bacterium]
MGRSIPLTVAFGGGRDGITIRTIHVAVALSLLLHALALWQWPSALLLRPFSDDSHKEGEPGGTLAVRLAPIPVPRDIETHAAPALAMPPSAPARPSPPAPHPAHRASQASQPVLAMARPSASSAPPKPSAAAAPAPPGQDLASFVEARRRARSPDGAPSAPAQQPPGESEQERINREAATRLGLNATPSFGSNKNTGGGTFQVREMHYDHAQFAFYGWNKLINHNSLQLIDVAKGDNASIELAVVRKMIAIIRSEATGDFQWDSLRLNRSVVLSARAADNAGLEAFMMEEFFSTEGRSLR